MRTEKKLKLKQLRHWRIRKRLSGTSERPRMSVCFTSENIHVQFIDDVAGAFRVQLPEQRCPNHPDDQICPDCTQ